LGGGPSTRLDTADAFPQLLHALWLRVQQVDDALRDDVSVLTVKVGAAREAVAAAHLTAERTEGALQAAEDRTVGLLTLKRTTARKMHALLTGGSEDGGNDAQEAPPAADVRGRAGSSAAMAGATISRGHQGAAAVNPALLRRYGSLLSAMDGRVKEASAAWKKCVWEHTLATTRLDELRAARDALMAQLVALTGQAEARNYAAARQLWMALAEEWGRRHALGPASHWSALVAEHAGEGASGDGQGARERNSKAESNPWPSPAVGQARQRGSLPASAASSRQQAWLV
jgi:hypothetical protein